MLGVLIKKQLSEIFRGYLYDTRKNKARSKGASIAMIGGFALIMAVFLGGAFFSMANGICRPLTEAGLGWLYFALIGLLAILIGALGSVFSTYAGLYLAKDNDFLLSLPIPVRTIVASRLFTVYLMGLLFSGLVALPAAIAYWIAKKPGPAEIAGGLLFVLLVSAIVLALSCLLGYGIARLSVKLKNKSYITTIFALLFLGVYYVFYYRMMLRLQDFLGNIGSYVGKIEKNLGFLKTFGEVGEGKWLPMLLSAAAVFALCALVWIILLRSFMKIAAASGETAKVRYREKTVRQRSVRQALESKEFGRFTSSANYMLNSGLGTIFTVVAGVALLVKGRDASAILGSVFGAHPGAATVLFAGALCTLAGLNDQAVPSVSLEGKSLWILQSLPVDLKDVIRAKIALQLKLTLPPVLFASAAAGIALCPDAAGWFFIMVLPALAALFFAAFGMLTGIRHANLNWTNELVPIKQSAAVFIYLLIGMLYGPAMIGLFFLTGSALQPTVYLAAATVLTAALALLCLMWLRKKGAAKIAEL